MALFVRRQRVNDRAEAKSERLIFFVSSMVIPVARLLFRFSEPPKSISAKRLTAWFFLPRTFWAI